MPTPKRNVPTPIEGEFERGLRHLEIANSITSGATPHNPESLLRAYSDAHDCFLKVVMHNLDVPGQVPAPVQKEATDMAIYSQGHASLLSGDEAKKINPATRSQLVAFA